MRHQSGYSCLWGSDSNYFLLVLFYYWLVFVYERHSLLPKGLTTESRTNRAKEENASGGLALNRTCLMVKENTSSAREQQRWKTDMDQGKHHII